MSSKVIFCSGFVCGAMVGAIGIWKYVENKYERIAQEEIDSVKNVYSKRVNQQTSQRINVIWQAILIKHVR